MVDSGPRQLAFLAGLESHIANVISTQPDHSSVITNAATFDPVSRIWVAAPIDLSLPAVQVYLVLSGTGIRNASSLAAVNVNINSESYPAQYAGPTAGYPGLDQVNVGPLSSSL